MTDRLALPVRVKFIRLDEAHLFCAGENCDARLGVRYHIGSPFRGKEVTRLEPRYTNDTDPVHPYGTWWRRRRGGYRGSPRYRDVRRDRASGRSTAEPVFGRRLSEATKYTF